MILDFSGTVYMDDSAALVVEQLIDTAMEGDTECIVLGLKGSPAVTLRALNALRHVPPDHFVKTVEEARDRANRILKG